MTDRIFEIGKDGLGSSDERVRNLIDNMVNAQTPGYRKRDILIRSFPLELEVAQSRISAMTPKVEGTYYDQTHGTLARTDNKLDMALGSDGFFVVLGPWGEGYTRDGRFRLDKEGQIVSVAGNFSLMGQGGPIAVTPGAEVEVNQTGEILVDEVVVDRVRVVAVDDANALLPVNGSVFKLADPATIISEVEAPRVLQGYVETSNVSVIDSMMELIYLNRIYNMDTKVVQSRDQALSRAMELGKATQ